MVDLDALSRKVAAAGDEWMMPGVSCVDPVCGWRFRAVTSGAELKWVHEGTHEASLDRAGVFRVDSALLAGPNLRDPVTRNALLEDRRVSELRHSEGIGDYYWCGPTDAKGYGVCEPTVIEAICRAWIAARGKGNGN